MTRLQVPYNDFPQQFREERDQVLAAVEQVLGRGDFILGEAVRIFEGLFAGVCDVPHAVSVGSGTDALIIALRALGVGPGDEVITVSNTWVSTVSSIILVGATPVLVDVDVDMNLNPNLIENAVTDRTRAIIPVHLTGRPAKMDAIQEIADRRGLLIIEDAAQAVGAMYRGDKVGSLGNAGCFSLHPLKNLNGAGDGGAITCRDSSLADQFRLLRNHGLADRDHVTMWGYCSRLDTIQAAILCTRLERVASVESSRRKTAAFYNSELQGLVVTPTTDAFEHHVYHTYVIQTERRDQLQTFLGERGISSKVHYPIPIHLQPAAENLGCRKGDLPVTERLANQILTLPVNQHLSEDQVAHVAGSVREFFG
jgi:dTDP-4-amino-4,6-dideoxygalactose transaminase